MSTDTAFTSLRDRFEMDRGGAADGRHDLAAERLERGLDAIGWRSADGSSSEEVASVAVHIMAECVHGHHDVEIATQALADLLYQSAAMLDGSMFSASAFVPAAEEVLRLYVAGR